MSRLDRAAAALTAPAPILRRHEGAELLTAALDPVTWAVEGLIPDGHVTLLGGHGGSGKSLLAATIAAHVAAGQAWAGLPVRQGPVVKFSLEDPAALVMFRLRRIVEFHGLDPRAVARGITVLDGTEGDAALVREVAEDGVRRLVPTAALGEIESAARGAALIVVDNASDAFDGAENDRRQVRAFVRWLARIARDVNAGLLLLAHVDKAAARLGSNGESYSGSTAWHNSARSRLALIEAAGRLELHHEKCNLGPKLDPIPLAWEGGVLVASRADPAARLAADANRTAADAVAVLEALEAAEVARVTIPTARSGPVTTWHALATLPAFPDDLRDRADRLRFWAALDHLAATGRIVRESFRDNRRHERERWRTRAGTRADAPVQDPESARHTSPHTPLCEPAHLRGRAGSQVSGKTGTRANPRKPAQQGCTAAEYLAGREGA